MPTTFPVSSATFIDTAYLNAYGARLLGKADNISAAATSIVQIPQTYKHLMVAWKAKGTNVAAASDRIAMRLPSISNIYVNQDVHGVGATTTAEEGGSATQPDFSGIVGLCAGASGTGANNFSVGQIWFPNYTDAGLTALYQHWLAISGGSWNSSTGAIHAGIYNGQYYTATPGGLASIQFQPYSGTALANFSWRLYGMG